MGHRGTLGTEGVKAGDTEGGSTLWRRAIFTGVNWGTFLADQRKVIEEREEAEGTGERLVREIYELNQKEVQEMKGILLGKAKKE